MARQVLLGVLLIIVFSTTAAHSSIYVAVEDAALTRQAHLIVRAEIVGSRVDEARGFPSTYYEAILRDVIKGEPTGSRIEVRVPGGRSSQAGRELVIHGAPTFKRGQRALLFLRTNEDGTYRLLHLLQGAFMETDAGNGTVFQRSVTEPRQVVEAADGSGVELAEPARHGERFVAWLRDRVARRNRAADYFVADPPAVEPGVRASFTHLSSKIQLRWFEFDEPGGSVTWYRHIDGQSGVPNGAQSEFQRALGAWKHQSGTGIRLTDGGTTTSTAGFTGQDQKNTILFSDINDVVGDDFDCASGGYIAIGGVSAYYSDEREYKGQPFHRIAEAEIVINDGVECLFEGRAKMAAQVYAHELGHTLGLGHACGDSSSPKCSSSDVLDRAIMRAYAHGKKGAVLADDDIGGARYLYDPEFFAVPCDLPPGHKKFCRRCGPCGKGQGSCRKQAHCQTGLTCAKRVGADFGLAPRVNVCTVPD